MGYLGTVHGLADSCYIHFVGGLRIEYTVENRGWTVPESGKYRSGCDGVQMVNFSLANDWLS